MAVDTLSEIMARTRRDLESRLRPVRPGELERMARQRRSGRSFAEALCQPGLRVIAEVKRRSPSAGDIAKAVVAVEQARRYYNAGADAISVLTNEPYFGGRIEDLWEVNDLLGHRIDAPPTLRKDFFVDPLQVLEAAEAGARAILLIVRALDDSTLRRLREAADLAGLDALYEVHTEAELERALHFAPRIVGVNNRDLASFRTSLEVSEELIPRIPKGIVRISESGIASLQDAQRARSCGADAVLVGEALMRADEPEELIEAFHEL